VDVTDIFKKRHMKHFSLRIKPRVMKRHWRSICMKRKHNPNEAQHVEASLYFLLLDKFEVVQSCSRPVHEFEEATNLSDEFEEPVEDAHASTPIAQKDKEAIIYVDGIMKEPLDMVDETINTFI
jgi:hypothetical protein